MMRTFYTLFFYLSVPFILLRLWWKGRKNPAYRKRIQERFGFTPFECRKAIWLHAVSLGEAAAAIPLIEALLDTYPDHPMVVTTTTPAGSEKITQHFKGRVFHSYFPYDLPCALRLFFKRIQPSLLLIMETELWPNLIRFAKSKNVPVMLVNGRISDFSIKKYLYLRPFVKDMLQEVDQIAAQSALDAQRFEELGADPQKVINVGNLKFDMKINEHLLEHAQKVRPHIPHHPIWIAASTHKNEDEQILKIHQAILKEYPEALLIIVPRHSERFDEVAALCEKMNLPFVRKSQGLWPDLQSQVFLGDSMGELQFYYALADVAFVGGTLVPVGGHNPLEPLLLGKNVIVGPYTQNAKMLYDELVRAGLVVCLKNEEEVQAALLHAFKKPSNLTYIEKYMQHFRGIKDRIIQLIAALYGNK